MPFQAEICPTRKMTYPCADERVWNRPGNDLLNGYVLDVFVTATENSANSLT